MTARLPPHRVAAICIAASWLAALTIWNDLLGGSLRSTLLFAIPVVLVAWDSATAGFIVAAVAVVCAWAGGAMPEPDSPAPLWLDALVAFGKLSIDAFVVNLWGTRRRARAAAEAGAQAQRTKR